MGDLIAAACTAGGAIFTLQGVQVLQRRGLVTNLVARKLMHIAAGLGYLLTWPLYGRARRWRPRLFAAFAPAAQCVRFALVSRGVVESPGLVAATARTGSREELLRGPCLYALAIAACTLLKWRESPGGIAAIAALCGGDGVADLAGRRFGHVLGALPHNRRKTWAGSTGCALGALGAVLPQVALFNRLGYYRERLPFERVLGGSVLCSLAAAAVESLPGVDGGWDNVTVPAAVCAMAPWAYGTAS